MNIIESNYSKKIDNLMSEMNKITDNEYFHNNKDSFAGYLIDAVHAIADCYERNRDKLSGYEKDFILAFRYLNNQLKHDKNLVEFCMQIYSAVLPSYLPLRLGSTSYSIEWVDFTDNGKPNAEAKREHYDNYLNGKDVKESFIEAKRILNAIVNN